MGYTNAVWIAAIGYSCYYIYNYPDVLDLFKDLIGNVFSPLVFGVIDGYFAAGRMVGSVSPLFVHMSLEFLQAQGSTYKRAYLRKWNGDHQTAEHLFQLAAMRDPRNGHAWFNIGEIRALNGDLEAARWNWNEACWVYQRQGVSLAHLPINTKSMGEQGYKETLQSEANDVFDCATKIEDERPGQLRKKPEQLKGAVQAWRAMESNQTWILKWAESRYGPASQALAKKQTGREDDVDGVVDDYFIYGAVWFNAWRQICETEPVLAVQKQRPGAKALVLGSGLGEQCVFALAGGFRRCVGYETLCEGLNTPGQELVKANGLSELIDLRCQDAREMDDLDEVSLIFMNDDTWPEFLRWEIWDKAARHLQPGSVIVSFGTNAKGIPFANPRTQLAAHLLPIAGRLHATVSWGTGGIRAVSVLVKAKPEPKVTEYMAKNAPAYPGMPDLNDHADGGMQGDGLYAGKIGGESEGGYSADL